MATDASVRETNRLISSDKVEGTAVRRRDGDKIGTIEHLMIDKFTGKVAYAVMSFGGFLGMGEEYYALPWSTLTYKPALGAYEMNVTDEMLRSAPATGVDFIDTGTTDRAWEDTIHRHYGATPYW